MGSKFIYGVHENPIIAAVKKDSNMQEVISSQCNVIFLLYGNISNIKDIVNELHKDKKIVYIHVDLIDGISNDIYGLEYIVKKVKPDGIITTKGSLITAAKKMGIFTIQRLFILDSLSYDRSIRSAKKYEPDAIEILPGIIHKVTRKISMELRMPIIAGGLIKDKEDVIEAIKAGATAVSSTNSKVWEL
ncbi:MAG: glycerol-3-phosphate responsive antiterminator [Bacillota bacterium]|nr:glycerol-3-phosphate responsive antiterminator [Bacillota bacterium]